MSSIGSFDFVNMDRRPAGPQEGVQLESQAGVDGVTAWLVGSVGRVSQVVTFRDCVSLADALARMAQYETAPQLGALACYYGTTLLPFGLKVLEVTPLECKQIVKGIGGINGTSRAILRARWSVIAWKTP